MTEPLSHIGPWTAADLVGLPDDGQRYEIIDGSLLVSPPPSTKHQLVSGRLAVFLRESAPDDADVVEAVGLRMGSGRLLIPDVVVATSSALHGDDPTIVPGDVLMVVEVVSPRTRRWTGCSNHSCTRQRGSAGCGGPSSGRRASRSSYLN
jgi:Uma2 family endonuclease